MKQKKDKIQISKERAEMFKQIVGDTKSDDIEITDKKHIMKDMLNRGDTPPGLKAVESIFNYICNFFTFYVPLAILIGIAVSDKLDYNAPTKEFLLYGFAPYVLKVLLFSVISFCSIKVIEFLVSCVLIAYYSKVLDKAYKQAKYLEDKIKKEVDGEENPETEEKVTNSNPAAIAFNNIVECVCKEAVSSSGGNLPMDLSVLKTNVSAILYNIFSTKSMEKVKDRDFSNGIISGNIYDEHLFLHTSNDKEIQKYSYKCIYDAGLKTDWFTK